MINHHYDMKLAYNVCTISCMDSREVLWVTPKYSYPSSKFMFCKFPIKTKMAFYKTVSIKTHVFSINPKPIFYFERIFWNMVLYPEKSLALNLLLLFDSGEDIVMRSDAKYYHITYNKVIKLSSVYIIIKTHHWICTVIDFEATIFSHHLLHDPMLLGININYISYLIWQCYNHHMVGYQIYINANYEIYKLGIWPYDGNNIVTLDRKSDC